MSYNTPSVIPVGVAQWVKVSKTYADFSTAGLTNDIEIYSLPNKYVVHSIVMNSTVKFQGGTISTYTMSVGTVAGSYVNYVIASDVKGVSQGLYPLITAPVAQVPITTTAGGPTSIRARAISTVDTLDHATQGTVDFYLFISKLP